MKGFLQPLVLIPHLEEYKALNFLIELLLPRLICFVDAKGLLRLIWRFAYAFASSGYRVLLTLNIAYPIVLLIRETFPMLPLLLLNFAFTVSQPSSHGFELVKKRPCWPLSSRIPFVLNSLLLAMVVSQVAILRLRRSYQASLSMERFLLEAILVPG